jgi:hypothetical protein
MTTKIVIGLIIFLLLGIVNAECEKEQENLAISIHDYNRSVTSRMDEYNKGDKGQACSMDVQINHVFAAYSELSECYYKAGNQPLFLEMESKMKEWGEKDIEWSSNCGLKTPEENRAEVYNSYVFFYDVLKNHDCALLNKSGTACLKLYNDNANKSCYYCTEYNKYTTRGKITCKYHGCPEGDTGSSDASDTGNKVDGSVLMVAVGLVLLVLILGGFFLLGGKKHKSK